MAIKPICDRCHRELLAFGAILFSPPDADSQVKKYHICVDCYRDIVGEFTDAT
jgi:hypothetical protein